MHIDHDHNHGHCGHHHNHDHEHCHHDHDHEHCHHDHDHEHCHHDHDHEHCHNHDHEHCHNHNHDHEHCGHHHEHNHGGCGGCGGSCQHTPMEELTALMKYMVGHNASHAKELADLANQLQKAGNQMAYEQVMAAVSDFEKGNMRLSVVLASMDVK